MYEDATLYSSHSQDHQDEANRMLNKHGHHLTWSNDEIILDLGCGSGDVTNNILLPYIDTSLKTLVGGDMSEKMIQFARKRWTCDPRVHYHILDISKPLSEVTTLPKDLQQFDKIFSFFCLQWVKDRSIIADNLKDLLKPGGQAFLLLVANSGIYMVWDTIAESPKWKEFFKPINFPLNEYIYMNSPDEVFCKELRRSGLLIKESLLEERSNIFTTKIQSDEEMITRLRTVDPLINYLPAHLKDEYMKEVLELTKKLVSPQGATDYLALIVVLTKPI